MTNDEILAIYFAECEDALAEAESGLASLMAGSHDFDTVNGVFRAVHSIKGGAGAFGFAPLQTFAHGFESLLSDVRDGSLEIADTLIDLMLRALDLLSDHVKAARDDLADMEDASLIAEMMAVQASDAVVASYMPEQVATVVDDADAGDFDLDAILDEIGQGNGCQPCNWQIHLRPHAGAMRNGGEPLLLLRELADLGGNCSICHVDDIPALDQIDPGQGYLAWTFVMPPDVTEDRVRDIFGFFGDDCAIAIGEDAPVPAPEIDSVAQPTAGSGKSEATVLADAKRAAAPARQVSGQSIRVDLAKLDRLIDSVGELVIAQAMMAQRLSGENQSEIEELSLIETLTREIQESAMSIRAQPVGTVFSRVPRLLRELASSTGKQVTLDVSGEATELDNMVIERLGEPITHLVRNAIDHGIESAEDRLAVGKPAEGRLSLEAEQRSGRILIRISDDGRGIERDRVLAKAIERGLVASGAELADEQIDNLIFAPGFSTAVEVSAISGRGVGMDVVRQGVKELGGRITIESEIGKGTTFTLTLPLTLAISEGMIVNVGDQTVVVPLASVVESLKPGASDVQGLGTCQQMLNVRGCFIPVFAVHHLLGVAGNPCRPDEGVLIVVETETAGQVALLVDDICDQRQFVIKSLERHYRPVDCVAGATILGDGSVALILDIDGIGSSLPALLQRRAA